MSRWRQAFNRIGGPDAVTWPAFWVTSASAILGHLTTGGKVDASIAQRILIVCICQVVLFIPLIGLRFTLLKSPTNPRPWVAIGGFIFAAVLRGFALAFLLLATGAVSQPLWVYRIIASLMNQAVLLIIVALVVSTMRAHVRTLIALTAIQDNLEATQARIIDEVNDHNDEAIERVQVRLRQELEAFGSGTGTESVEQLQRIASDVVRPMSHELGSFLPRHEDLSRTQPDAHVSWQQLVRQLADHSPLRPLLVALYLAISMIAATLGPFGNKGFLVTVIVSVVALICSALGNAILNRLLPHTSGTSSLVAIFITSLLIGVISVGAGSLTLERNNFALVFFICGSLFTCLIELLAAVLSAVVRQQRASEREFSTQNELLRREIVRLRQSQWIQQKSLSRALHGPLQSTVTSAALRLDAALRSDVPIDVLVTEIQQELRSGIEMIEIVNSEEHSLELAFARLTGTWEGVCTIDAEVSNGAHERLTCDPIALATVIDILTEAVSNAVRHGNAEHTGISIVEVDDALIQVTVVNDGYTLGATPNNSGLGTALLEECTLSWTRDSNEQGHELVALIPIIPKMQN